MHTGQIIHKILGLYEYSFLFMSALDNFYKIAYADMGRINCMRRIFKN